MKHSRSLPARLWGVAAAAAALLHLALSVVQYYDEKFWYAALLRREKYLALLLLLALLGCAVWRLRARKAGGAALAALGRRPELWLPACFALWCLLAAFAACRTGSTWKSLDAPLYDVFFSALLLAPLAVLLEKEQRETLFDVILAVLVLALAFAMLLVLFLLYTNRTPFSVPGGQVGLDTELRLRLNCHGNTTGAYALTLSLASLYLALRRGVWPKLVFGAAFGVHLAVMLLSNSRTALLALLFSLSLLAAVRLLQEKRLGSLARRIGAAALAVGALLAGVLLLRAGLYALLERQTHTAEALSAGENLAEVMITPDPVTPEEAAKSEEIIAARESESSGGRALNLNTNGRTEIWRHCLSLLFADARRALFGYTPSGIRPAIRAASSGAFNTYSHNQFLEIALGFGLPALLLFLAWLLVLFTLSLRLLLRGSVRDAVLPVLLLALVIANLTEAYLVYYHYLPGAAFFLVSGFAAEKARRI